MKNGILEAWASRLHEYNQKHIILLRTTKLIFEAFQIHFPTASWIFAGAKLFHQEICERTKPKSWQLWISCFETMNVLHVSICKMFTFCDVLHETKQKNWNKLLRVRSLNWKSALNFLEQLLNYTCTGKWMRGICKITVISRTASWGSTLGQFSHTS